MYRKLMPKLFIKAVGLKTTQVSKVGQVNKLSYSVILYSVVILKL